MPVHFFASTVSSTIPSEYWATIAATCVAISFLKTWSKGAKLLDPPPPPPATSSSSSSPTPPPPSDKLFTDLHGRVVLVATGAFTPLGVVTLSSLAHRGAQIIALTPDISDPSVIQLVHLIRDSTQSELIYAEQCDVASLESISAFAALWNSGDKKQQEGVRRLDGVLFLPPGRDDLGTVQGSHPARADRVYQLHVLAKFHLINSLLSGLLVQPPEREVRIVSAMSPFYAAGVGHFDVLSSTSQPSPDREGGKKKAKQEEKSPQTQLQKLSESSYSALIGAASLRWYALTVELQRRLDLLAEADPRPRTKLPGIDLNPNSVATRFTTNGASSTAIQDEAASRMKRHSNISVINVCPGFERSTDIIDTFLPPPSHPTSPNPIQSTIHLIRSILRYILLLLIWPFVWLLAKSPATAADSLVWATTRSLEPLSERYHRIISLLTKSNTGSGDQIRRWQDNLIPGEMYREGRIVRPQLPHRFGSTRPADTNDTKVTDAWSDLWKHEEQEVERRIKALGGQIKRPQV
ncbi:hypothetical protein PHSY_002836 [Pseudozyma hubeiensis SY62]|uniref:Uncharacterized protein n=1 Tax=Pseudozyma hubeiensis (strain SY62) TaxID=1305764 RepID=R9P1W9_PSEHS|nr:hypothetical protein PHSY_002836 [Pseudozyma hubeiensis SY62]GAC95261.1 hypothetical protein PHSY_002836 [Pseudozyma hubeiensis SY62]